MVTLLMYTLFKRGFMTRLDELLEVVRLVVDLIDPGFITRDGDFEIFVRYGAILVPISFNSVVNDSVGSALTLEVSFMTSFSISIEGSVVY